MIVLHENDRFYLRSLDFNMCRIFTALAVIVKNHNGKVKSQKKALVCDRSLKESELITVTHTSYITFALDEVYYYFQVDENPFFPFYYQKTPIKAGKYSRDACLDEFPKDWLLDCLWSSGVCDADIIEVANLLFNRLVNAKFSVIRRNSCRRKVANTFDAGWHWENVCDSERFANVDF